MQFQQQHAAMLLKYSGISFISGAVNHGFFSGERSLWTAAIGMLLFVVGAWMEHRQSDAQGQASDGLLRTLVLGALLSVGLGFFTGGLQHFPDSPARSAWVVPLGFFISVPALALSASLPWQRGATVYAVLVGALVTGGSYGAWQWLAQHPEWAATGHSHGPATADAHGAPEHAGHAPATGMVAMQVSRSIEVRMDDQMRFTPSQLEVREGETIRFVVHNAGAAAHEMVLGSDEDIREHAQAMQQGASHGNAHRHGTGAAITVAAGQRGELVVKFDAARTLQMACLIPGHYEAGMRGTVKVLPAPSTASTPSLKSTPAPAHDHSTHKH
jgi:uncharacterized cupredoxin-like copper-binding protein